MTEEEGRLAPSTNFWIHRKQGQLVYQWMYVLDPRPRLGLPTPLTRCCLGYQARPVIIGVSLGLRSASGVACHQIRRGGDTVKAAILNSVGIILVVAACLILCVALNAVSTS
jgi:hypothetical protein